MKRSRVDSLVFDAWISLSHILTCSGFVFISGNGIFVGDELELLQALILGKKKCLCSSRIDTFQGVSILG